MTDVWKKHRLALGHNLECAIALDFGRGRGRVRRRAAVGSDSRAISNSRRSFVRLVSKGSLQSVESRAITVLGV